MLLILQTTMFLFGISLLAASLFIYVRRSGNWNGLWQVWVGQLKDFNLTEFRLFRSSVLVLFLAIIVRIVNLTLNG